jgi:hypothetical protein
MLRSPVEAKRQIKLCGDGDFGWWLDESLISKGVGQRTKKRGAMATAF